MKVFLLLSILISQVVFAKDQTAKEFIVCKNTQEVRILSILVNDQNTCVAHYSKKGKDEVIAQAKSLELCHDRLKQIQGILKSANYNCRSVAKAQVSTSSEASQQ